MLNAPIKDTPPHVKLVEVPHGTALFVAMPDPNNEVISEIIAKHWRTHYKRVQLLQSFLNFDRYITTYPSIDKHGRIIFVPLKNPMWVDIYSEQDRRIWLLSKATTSFIVHFDYITPYILDRLMDKVNFDYIFCDAEVTTTKRMDDIRSSSKVPHRIIHSIYEECQHEANKQHTVEV